MRKTPNNTVRVAAAGAQLLNKKAMDAFCKNNQDFDLQQFNFFNQKAVAALHWGEADQATLLPQLKALQRLVRLTNNLETAEALYKRGLHAAVQIASMPAHKFVAQYKDAFIPNGLSAEAQAQQVHQKALARKSQAVLTYTAIAQHTAHHYRATRFDNLSAATASSFDGVPSYQELFGDLDFCDCPDCRSIFSPAAYFVDLMRLQDHYITGTKEPHQLKTRRPDLWTTELSCDNTHTQVSKLEIVNKVLRNAWETLDKTATYEKLATTHYPFNLPFNLPLTQIRQYLRQNKQTLPQLWQSLLTPIDDAAQQAIDREILPLAPAQWTLYSTPVTDGSTLCGYYGVSGNDPVSALTPVKDFLAQTGLPQVQLNELLSEDLSDREVKKKGLNANFFINTGTDIPPISIDETKNTLTNLTVLRLDHINRFVRLAQALGWSFTDLDWALSTIAKVHGKDTPAIDEGALHYLAWMQTLQQAQKCSINQACALIGTVKDFGKKEGPTFFEQIFNNPNIPNPPQWKNEQGAYSLVWDLSKPDSDLQIQAALTAALKVSLDDLFEMASQLLSALGITNNQLPLTLKNLSILYRLSQLPALTGLAIDECFVALALPGFSPDALKQLAGNDLQAAQKQLVALTDFAQWIKTTSFSVYQLQYILTGRSAQATIQNQLLGTTAITNFTKSTQKAIKATLLTQQQLSTAVQPLLQQSEYSPEAAKDVYKTLQKKGYIDQDGKVIKVPDTTTMQDITLQVYPAGTKAAENPYVASLSKAFIALLTKYNQKILGEDAFVKETASSFLHFLRADNLVTQLWKALQVTDEQPWYIDPHGVITKEATNEQVKERVKPVLFPQIPSSALENIVTLVTNTLNSALQLQHETLTRHLGSLYGLSSALVFALEIWGHLTIGNGEADPMVQQGQEDAESAATLLLQALLAATSSTIDENSKIGQYLQKMQPYAQLLKSLSLSAAETQALVDHPEYFGVGYQKANSSAAQPQFTITNIKTLDQFKKLVQSLQDTQNRLLEYFQLAATATDRATIVQKLHQLTQWDKDQLQFLFDKLWPAAASNTIPGYATVKGVAQLQAYFTITQQLNLAIQSTWRLKALHATTAYGDFQNAAHTLWAGLQKQYQDQPATLTKVQNALNANKRDALLRLMMDQLRKKELPITTTRDLYEYLLIDVAVMGEVQTSYVKEAIAAVQLYIYRCRNHLEPGVTVAKELDTWWSWLEHYRVWQANREVFLYPENYIQPELRKEKEKSEQFVQLEQALQQSSLKETNVDTAVKTYLDGFATVANLQIVGSYLYANQAANDAPHAQQNLYLVGRTSTQPYTYYYRTGTFNYSDNTYTATQWSPWIKIDVQINSTLATPVFAFDRLFLFWVETKQGKSDRNSGEESSSKRFEATLYYSYYDFNKQWVASQQLGDVLPLPSEVDTAAKAAQPEWQQLKAIFVPSEKAIYWAYNGHQGMLTAQLQAIEMTSMVVVGNFPYVYKLGSDGTWSAAPTQTISSPAGSKNFGTSVALWGSWAVVGARDSSTVYVYKLGADGTWLFQSTQPMPPVPPDSTWLFQSTQLPPVPPDSTRPFQPTQPIPPVPPASTGPFQPTQPPEGPEGPKGPEGFGGSVALWGSWCVVGAPGSSTVYVYKLGADDTWTLAQPISGPAGSQNFGWSVALEGSCAVVGDYNSSKVYVYKLEANGMWTLAQTISNPAGSKEFGYAVALWDSWAVVGIHNSSKVYLYKLEADGTWTSAQTISGPAGSQNFGSAVAFWHSYTDILRNDRIPTLAQQLDWSIVTGPDKSTQFLAIPGPTGQPSHIRLNDTVVQQLSSLLFSEGMEGLLALHTQYTPEVKMNGSQTSTLDFTGANEQYYWELFFHMPFLVAHSLSTQQQFKQAKQWYEYVFNPTVSRDNEKLVDGEESNDKYWQFLRLRSRYNPTLKAELSEAWEVQADTKPDSAQLAAYHNDPFDPHAIARLRPIAYQKTLVMHYIDNLLNWADNLYRQNTIETIEEATMFYVMAYDLLGQQPVSTGPCPLPAPERLADVLTHYGNDLSKIPEFLINVEQHQGVRVVSTATDTPHNYIPGLYFGLPDNAQFMGYWDKVRQRLYNIRHGLTIDGQVDHLALFAAPINPMQLVSATSSGEAVAEATSIGPALLPHYRFSVMVAKAQAMVQTVIQLGQSFLSALEKKDAEQLTLLYNTQQQDLLALTRVSKQDQLEAATQSRNAMQASLQNAQDRKNHYTDLISQGLSSGELAHITLESVGIDLQTAAQAIKGAAIVGYLAPTIFGFSDGGMHPGEALSQGAHILEGSAQSTSMAGGLAATMAGYQRRAEDWQLQQTLAQDDVKQIQYQILAAQYQQAFAQQEIAQLEKQVSQLQAVKDFLKNKFTSQQLYQWTLGQLSTLYFQAYQLAYTMAQQAEQAWQFERGKQQTFTHPGHWNELYHGLVAGEALQLDLQRMEKAYMDQNERKLEIEKVISLNQLSPQALLALKSKGSCIIELTEKDFDFDYPGHYFRQIKNISLSFPSLLGPYQNIHATLTQTSNRTLLQADAAGVQYLLGVTKEQPDNSILRVDARVYQQVALSQGLNDSGLFELNFNDERYLPFEGTGAISNWQLDMPKEDNALHFDSLVDVVIRLRYTAFSGGKAFQDAVKQARGAFQSHRSVMVAQEFASAWYGFTHNKTPLALTISPSLFRPNFSTYHLTDVTLMLVLTDQGKKQGWKDTQLTLQPSGQKFTLGGDPSTGIVAATEKISVEVTPQGLPWKIEASSYELITEENISDMVIVLGYTAKS